MSVADNKMKTYFIRHTKVLDIDDATLGHLIKNNLIAIHYPYLESKKEEHDTRSLNPDQYQDRTARAAMRRFVRLQNEGGYVCAEYRSLEGARIGKVSPGSKIELFDGAWGNKGKHPGRKAVLKTLRLEKVQDLAADKYLIISSGRPRQGTIMVWHGIGERVKRLVENEPRENQLGDLSTPQQEVLCSEFLRVGLDSTHVLPRIESFLLPVGRTLRDIDILGITKGNDTVYAQVTYCEFNSPQGQKKFAILKEKYASGASKVILFCRHNKAEVKDNIVIYPLDLVFDSFRESDIGKRWLKSAYQV